MLIHAVHDKKNPYVVINKSIASDNRLSWKAKGLWLYAFSRPDDWQFYQADLVNQSIDSRDSVRSGLKELIEFGYLVKIQQKGLDGTFKKSEWIFYETSQLKEKVPNTENPTADNPSTVKSDAEDPPLLNKEDKLNKEETNNTHNSAAPDRVKFGDFVKFKEGEKEKLDEVHGKSQVDEIIQEMNDYCAASKPKGYNDYAAAIRQWMARRKKEQKDGSTKYQGVDRRTRNTDGSAVDDDGEVRF